jgi:uncharacterized protein (DUF983 family)
MAEVKRVAETHCPRCGSGRMGGIVKEMAIRAAIPHTCQQDMAAARDAMLAAFDAGVKVALGAEPVLEAPECADIAEKRAEIEPLP